MPNKNTFQMRKQLESEIDDLRMRLAQATSELEAIRSGQANVIVRNSRQGEPLSTLQGNEGIYRTLIEEMSEGALTVTLSGDIVYCNRRFAEMLKTPLERIIGSSIYTWLDSNDGALFKIFLAHPSAHDSRIELGMQCSDGVIVPTVISMNAIHVDGMQVLGLVVADLTEQKKRELQLRGLLEEQHKAEVELRKSERRNRAIVNAIPDLLFELDARGTFLDYSASDPSKLIMPPDKFMGKNLHEVFPPSIASAMFAAIQKSLATKEMLRFEYEFQSGDARRSFETHIVPLSENSVLVVDREITERKRAERKLRESEEKYRGLLESLDSAIVTLDFDGRVLYANDIAAKIVASDPLSLIGKTIHDYFSKPVACFQLESLRRIMREDKPRIFEYQIPLPGQLRWYRLAIQPLHDEQGQGVSVLLNATDIDELKTTQHKLIELNHNLEVRICQATAQAEDLYNNAPSGYHSFDWQGNIIYINDTELKWLGRTRDQVIGHSFTEFIPPHQIEQFSKLHLPAITSGQTVHGLEYNLVRSDGSTIPVLLQAIAVMDQAGNFVMTRGTLVDITDRKRAEQALQASEAKYRLLFENMNEGFALHEIITDENGRAIDFRFLDANNAYASQTGLQPSNIIGKTIRQVLPHADLRQIENYGKVALTGEPLSFEYFSGTFNRYYRVNAFSPQPRFFATIFEDVTNSKRAEASLRQSEESYRALFENSNDAIFLLGPDSTFLGLNPQAVQLLGAHSAQELVGRHSAEFIESTQKEDADASSARLFAGEFLEPYERTFVRLDGTKVDTEITLSLLHNQFGYPYVAQSLVRDITARKKAELALQQANAELAKASKLKSEFLANMSHELRTPLNAILGLSESLLEQILGPLSESQSRSVTMIQESGQHLLSLINDILDLSKIEAGAMNLEIEPIDLKSTCQASMLFIKMQAHKKQIKTLFEFDERVEWISADQRAVKQILVNLLTNAVKFTPEGGQLGLEVKGDSEKNQIHLMVWDKGIGITQKDLSLLFQPFVQVDGSLTRHQEGTGLGLALVARLTEMHGGSVSVESEQGQGSRFTVTLPWIIKSVPNPIQIAKQNESNISQESSSPLSSNLVQDAPLILIAEDNETNIATISPYLKSKGYYLIVATNGEEAVALTRAQHPSVILMDLQMPVMNGLQAIHQLRGDQDRMVTRIPIIALTALAMQGDRERAIEAGANEYLSKPVNLKQLVEVIERLRFPR